MRKRKKERGKRNKGMSSFMIKTNLFVLSTSILVNIDIYKGYDTICEYL